jgi:hypothetical protein
MLKCSIFDINSIYLGPSMVKWTKKYTGPNLNIIVFQHKHKKLGLNFCKSLIMEACMLPFSFYELNIGFEKI